MAPVRVQRQQREFIQPILDPLIDEDQALDFDWYYGPEAGGFVLSFPKHAGKELRTVDLGYLEFCAKSTRNEPFKAALPRYLEGLNAFIDDTTARPGLKYHYTYLQVRVPFGKKYFGMRLGACRDKKYFTFCSGIQALREKYPLFFRALQHHFDNPNKQEKWRDIGDPLGRTELQDEFDADNFDINDYLEETEYDKEFIDDDDLEDENDDGSEGGDNTSSHEGSDSDRGTEDEQEEETSATKNESDLEDQEGPSTSVQVIASSSPPIVSRKRRRPLPKDDDDEDEDEDEPAARPKKRLNPGRRRVLLSDDEDG